MNIMRVVEEVTTLGYVTRAEPSVFSSAVKKLKN
jgi:hypothetical protein